MPDPNPTVLTDAYIAINGTALSSWAHHVEITDTADQIEVTGFSPAGYKQYIPGLKAGNAKVTFFNDFGVGGAGTALENMLYTLYKSGGTLLLELRPTSGAASATNPKYQMNCRMYSFSPMTGDVGNANEFQVDFQLAGTAGIVRGTV